MEKHARKSDAEKYETTMNNYAKQRANSQQKPSKTEVWKNIDFWIVFFPDFFVFWTTLFHPNLPSVRKVNCRKTNKKEEKEEKKEQFEKGNTAVER